MKKFFYTMIAILAVSLNSCDSDSSSDTTVNIPDLSLSNLTFMSTNLPLAYYDDLTFTDENTGYVVSRNGKILKTTNGGTVWNYLNSTVSFPLRRIQFVKENIGFVVGGDSSGSFILKTMDAGQSWSVVNLNSSVTGCPTAVYFKNEEEGYVTGNKLFVKTTDGGLTWTSVLGATDEDFTDVKFNDASYGIALTRNGSYYKTTDGGQNWQSIDLNHLNNLTAVYFVSGKTLVKKDNQLLDVSNSNSLELPTPVNRLLYLNSTKCIGIGQHYEVGFFPYGDILLTNDNWSTFLQKSYQPSSEAMDFTAIAKMSDHKVMILGTGQLNPKAVILSY